MKQSLTPLPLTGIHADTLGSYLTALGVLSATAQKWPSGRGCWRNGRFQLLGSASTADELVSFFISHWRPTRFDRWWARAQSVATAGSSTLRTRGKGTGRELDSLHTARREQTDLKQVRVFDAVMACGQRRVFNPIFGTGGNVGKRDLARVHEKCLELIGPGDSTNPKARLTKPTARSESRHVDPTAWLRVTLLGGEDVELPELRGTGTWFVFANKTFNSGQDWYREGHISPWSFLLAMEGAIMLRGSINRRLGARARGYGVFPFMCRPAAPSEPGEVGQGRAEFWAPLWMHPATMAEVSDLLRRGLTRIGGRAATAPHEFAAAAMVAGVDAGISGFARFELRQTTSAQVYEAVPAGRIRVGSVMTANVGAESEPDLITPLIASGWFNRLPKEPSDSEQRGKFVGLRGLVEQSMIRLAERPDDPTRWRELLLSLSNTQAKVDRNQDLRDRCIPLPRLSPVWFGRAWPNPPPEIQAARAIASIESARADDKDALQPLLTNIYGVSIGRRADGGARAPEFLSSRPLRTVWHDGEPLRVLADVLQRRLVDAGELDPVPVRASRPAPLGIIDRLLANGGGLDVEMIVQWVPPLSLIDWSGGALHGAGQPDEKIPLSPAALLHALFRPLIEPNTIVVGGRPLFPDDPSDSRRPHAAAVRSLVHMLGQNRIDEAIAQAHRRYLAAGVVVIDGQPEQRIDGERLVAALLIPVEREALEHRFEERWFKSSEDNRK